MQVTIQYLPFTASMKGNELTLSATQRKINYGSWIYIYILGQECFQ